ncbi:hypothetical protein [Paracoccus sp. (in: a-proteobacteria)]|uniref:hypothetical protein n=1 Tax=Paracoccus sp. TaxID=267 RepID=UPI0028AE750C|nr:hypothetical protein [Paracoccus sp. (in: a-proteobacteria)]
MLYPTAGSRFYIADAPADGGGAALPAAGWIEIGETEALGMVGVQWGAIDTMHMGSQGEEPIKGLMRRPPVQVILGNDPTDPGQALLWQASRSRAHYPFRLVFPDAARWRGWFGLVTGLFEIFDTANSVMKLQADVLPTSVIRRSEDS